MLASFLHLLHQALNLTVSYMGTTALAVGVGVLIFIIKLTRTYREKRWEGVREHFAGDLGLGVAMTVVVWLCLLAWCVAKATYDDHQSLLSRVRLLHNERDVSGRQVASKEQVISDLRTENEKLRSQTPKTVTRTSEPERKCFLSNHMGLPNSVIKGAVTATAAIVHCTTKTDAPFEVDIEFDRDFIAGAITLPDSGVFMQIGRSRSGRVYRAQIASPALLSNQLAIVMVYGGTDQYPQAVRATIKSLQ